LRQPPLLLRGAHQIDPAKRVPIGKARELKLPQDVSAEQLFVHRARALLEL
jgi:hypothetical protein